MLMRFGEVSFMLQPLRARRGLRPWVAVVAAYALALQVLLSGLAAGGLVAAFGEVHLSGQRQPQPTHRTSRGSAHLTSEQRSHFLHCGLSGAAIKQSES